MAEHRGRRLGALSRHLQAERRSNAAADDGTEAPEPELLDDGQVQKFLADGFLVLPLDENPEMHAAIHRAGQAYWENSGKVGGAVRACAACLLCLRVLESMATGCPFLCASRDGRATGRRGWATTSSRRSRSSAT